MTFKCPELVAQSRAQAATDLAAFDKAAAVKAAASAGEKVNGHFWSRGISFRGLRRLRRPSMLVADILHQTRALKVFPARGGFIRCSSVQSIASFVVLLSRSLWSAVLLGPSPWSVVLLRRSPLSVSFVRGLAFIAPLCSFARPSLAFASLVAARCKQSRRVRRLRRRRRRIRMPFDWSRHALGSRVLSHSSSWRRFS